MGQFDAMVIANMALEVAMEECRGAKTSEQFSEALESFKDASSAYFDAVHHRMELAAMHENKKEQMLKMNDTIGSSNDYPDTDWD